MRYPLVRRYGTSSGTEALAGQAPLHFLYAMPPRVLALYLAIDRAMTTALPRLGPGTESIQQT